MELKDVQFTFDLDFKAANSDEVFERAIELENGDLLIEGWGANYDIDREDEAFEEGAFTKGLQKFLSGNAPLCYHHRMSDVIGKVIEAVPVAGKGIKLRAIVDNQPENSPLRHIYEGIKKGRINQLSCGGIFKRRMTPNGPRIHDVDLLEWSTTPVAVGRGTNFSVIAGKALTEGKADLEIEPPPEVEAEVETVEEVETTPCEDCKKRAETEAAEENQNVEEPEEAEEVAEPEENTELEELFNKLDSLASRLETVAERWDDPAEDKETSEQEIKDTIPEGMTEDEINSVKEDMKLIKESQGGE